MKQAIISFTENMSGGFCHPYMKNIAMYIDTFDQSLRFYDTPLNTRRDSVAFLACRHRKFRKLLTNLELWEASGICSTVQKRFNTLQEWDAWRKTVLFIDREVHWQVFIQHDDGSWMLYLELNLSFPPELEQIYRLAASMKKP